MAEVKNFLPLFLVLSGTFNVLLIKWADKIESPGSDGVVRLFEHPFVQTGVMFIAQMLCFLVFKITFLILKRRRDGSEDVNVITSGGREFSPTVFLIPAFCDVISSAMLFTGIYLTYASSFQMLRSVSLIFVGILSVNFLNQVLKKHHWLGMFTISVGILLVCLADFKSNQVNPDSKAILTGDLLIICAQIFQAVGMVYEEKHIKALDIPALQAVGWQGIYGFSMWVFLMIPLNFLKVDPPFDNNARQVAEDFPDAIVQLFNNFSLVLAHGIFILTTALYNYSALSVTKDSSSTNRILIDSVRIFSIWLAALGLGWEDFSYLSLIGFLVLISGVFIYRNVVFVQSYRWLLGRISRRSYGDLHAEDEVSSRPADAI